MEQSDRMPAYRAARDWAREHGHEQPDDRMLDQVYDIAFKHATAIREHAAEDAQAALSQAYRALAFWHHAGHPLPETMTILLSRVVEFTDRARVGYRQPNATAGCSSERADTPPA